MVGRAGATNTLLGATIHRTQLDQAGPVTISGDQPQFHRIRAGNHRAPEIAGG
jgi:hypothetical protein